MSKFWLEEIVFEEIYCYSDASEKFWLDLTIWIADIIMIKFSFHIGS